MKVQGQIPDNLGPGNGLFSLLLGDPFDDRQTCHDLRGKKTGVLLIVFAAGLVAHGIHEFQEAGLLPVFIEHLWDTNPILDEKGTLGSILKSLFGYNGNPSLMEVLSYVGYYVVIGLAMWRRKPAAEALETRPSL